MGYEMYRLLLNPANRNPSQNLTEPALEICTRMSSGVMEVSDKRGTIRSKHVKKLYELLCDPGPDMV